MSSTTEPVDRRIGKTRRALRDALISLVMERGYEAITVADIADRANVNRATFYLHYKDKEDLLFRGMEEIYDALGADFPNVTREMLERGEIEMLCDPADFKHVAEHADFYRQLLSGRGSAAFIMRMVDYLSKLYTREFFGPLGKDGPTPLLPPEFMGAYLAGAEIGVIHWWLENDMPYSPEQMARMMFGMSAFGTMWALRLALTPSIALLGD